MAYLALKVKNSQIVKYLETPDYCHNVIKLSTCVPLTVYLGWSILHKAIINSLHISLWPLSVKTEKNRKQIQFWCWVSKLQAASRETNVKWSCILNLVRTLGFSCFPHLQFYGG